MTAQLFRAENISKDFSGVRVLNNISLEIQKGEIFGIIGENGAGKSTFVKILSGIYTPSSGQLYLEDQPIVVRSPIIAKNLGISMIPQEFNLVETLNVFENIFLGYEYQKDGLLDKRRMRQQTRAMLRELNTEIPPDATIRDLSVAQKQMVEIAKALAHESKILIMDEPTTVLTAHEIEVLFALMEKLKSQGVTILYISHKLKEVKRICDRVMVLRDGDMISINKTDDVNEHEMACSMVGRELNQIFPEKIKPKDEIVLRVQELSVESLLEQINFELKKGEILGFAGLVGAGRTELAETIMGLRKKQQGNVYIQGQERQINSPTDAVKDKLGYLSEDRQGRGILLHFDVPSNITLISLKKYARILINKTKEREKTAKYIQDFAIKTASMTMQLQFLSGGNQQKVYLSKWMDTEPEILILDEPTRGIDVNAKRELYHFITSLAQTGISCILISSEIEEIIGLCNRVIVMREGKITGELTDQHINEEEIMLYATGLKGKGYVQ
ncbi:MAG: sugar ABC transporter ATP-binding protein [Candidatus Vecturithrix sp.]|jgi:ribose transport system ATP-binding protein|nr:sugar ABC transporter ATP-binding protein [Candidatus Vecturithrix sp.]